jgi:hypothetical protein
VVGREDAAERRDVTRVLLERPDDRAAQRNLLRDVDTPRRRRGRTGKGARDDRAGADLARLLEQVAPADLPLERRDLGGIV